MTSFQNFLATRIAGTLSQNLKTKVSVKHVDFSFFNKMLLEGVTVEDRKKDTLLYAGVAKVNITDWFFIKDKATLKYIGLKDVSVNLKRTDSVWNYQFLVDYFSSPKDPNAAPKKGIAIDFKTMELENVKFNKIDKWVGQDLIVAVKKMTVEADTVDLSKNKLSFKDINLDNPVFFQSNYTGNRPEVSTPANNTVNITVPAQYKWNNDGWQIDVHQLHINNGSFQNEKETIRAPFTDDRFDAQHLVFAAINGNLKNIHFAKDTLVANISLSTKERSGFELKKLIADLKFTPDIMEFKNLDLATTKSRLGNYYAMSYDSFNESMSDFIHSVTLEGKFDNSVIHSDDIAFFAPALKTWNRSFDIKGNAKGTIDNLVAKNMLIKSGNTAVDGDIALRGLPDLKNTFIDFKSNDLVTNYADLITIIPALKDVTQPKLSKLGNIKFKGNFTGFINDFVTYGNINTNLGNIIADINMKLPDNKPATYSGKISSSGFNLGQFINTTTLGNIALDGNIVGSGFTLKDLNANFKGNVHQVEFSGYNYKNITLDGNFEKQVFTGHGAVDDPNLAIESFDGSASLAGKEAAFNFDAVLKKSNLKPLGFTKEDFALDGHFNLNFTGSNIDNFLGTAKVYSATLLHNNTKLSFDSLALNSFYADGKKHLSLKSNEVEAYVNGNFKILELPDAFKVFLSRYYPAYITKPKYNVSDQDFDFIIKTKEVDEYVQLLDGKLKGFNNATFSGNLKLAQNELNINANIPEFEYDKKIFNSVMLESKGNLDTLNTRITTGDIVLNDSLHFPGTNLSIKSNNDVSSIQLKTSASKTLSEAELNATVQTLTDGVRIHFSPSSFILNDKKWRLEKDGELTIRKAFIDASEVKFIQENQEITFSTEMDDVTDKTNVVAKLKKVNIDDFAPFFLKKPRPEGMLTGTITLRDPFGKPTVEYDALAENLVVDNKEIGNTTLKGDVNTTTGLVRFKADANSKLYKFHVDGNYNYKDSSDKQMTVDAVAEHFDISLLDNYLGSVFTNMKGDAVGPLKITGGPNNRSFTGSVTVTDGSFKVIYTQCKYNFTNTPIVFNPGEIDFGNIYLTDTLGNTGTLSGKLYHKFFDDFEFDNIKFNTGKMLLLNTTQKDNSQFYGKVIGNATMTLNGDITDMKMKISGKPSTSLSDSNHIYLPIGAGKEASVIDYIEFVQFGTEMQDVRNKQGTNISVDMDLVANPACKIDVILDEATGDIIKGSGTGNLNITVGSKEPLTMRGRYNITEGEYKFNFQTFIQKYFSITNGSSITWNGDPYEALININAEYLAPNVDLSSLATSSGKFNQKSDISIVSHLTNTLKAPVIDFEFVIPKEKQNDRTSDPVVLENLKKLAKDPNERNRQVASLLLFNSFINDGTNSGFGASINQFLSGTVGQVISGFLNNQLTKVFQKLFKDPTLTPYLSFNSNYNLTSKELINALEASGNFGFKKEYFNGRLIVSLGGNIDYNNPYILQARNTNVLLTPDITVEYILTADGKLRVVGFNRTSVDVTLGQRNRTGVRLSYQKEFDKKQNTNPKKREKKPVIKTAP
ncbi:translocation/assembly module TamB domain-containing protein [Ferruginibacter sp. SUN106]|uniref:translocation/assembly module TamB domain-containing protein n=1 Tax=Ferruginibacter sp. SUN106 TaxID=2978348 RepID=UPI003D366B74